MRCVGYAMVLYRRLSALLCLLSADTTVLWCVLCRCHILESVFVYLVAHEESGLGTCPISAF